VFRSTLKAFEEILSLWQNLKEATKSSKDHWIGGVCGGLGQATPLAPWMWRAIFLAALLGFGTGILVYVVLWICLPEEREDTHKALHATAAQAGS
jgi:phage shock protein PspC (stress-responsive transcriptional regulator)